MKYPKMLHASVLLLDGKIEQWKVSGNKKDHPYDFKNPFWKRERIEEYTVENKEWVVESDKENQDVFSKLAPEWFQQWEHAEDYKGWHAYGEERKF